MQEGEKKKTVRNSKGNFNVAQSFRKKKDNSLLSFTRITEFTLGQISEALAHNKKR